MLVLGERGKPEYPEKNLTKQRREEEENQQQTQPIYKVESRIEPGPHWWKASALTTAPSLLPVREHFNWIIGLNAGYIANQPIPCPTVF